MRKFLLTSIAATMLTSAGVANASTITASKTFDFLATSSSMSALFSWADAISTKETSDSLTTVEHDGIYNWALKAISSNTRSAKAFSSVVEKRTQIGDDITGDIFGATNGSFEHVFSGLNIGTTYQLVFNGKWKGIPGGNAWEVAAPSVGVVNVVAAPVPEPESYALMLAGLGLMGTIARRRSKSKAV